MSRPEPSVPDRPDCGKIANALTVDIEDFFQVSAFENTIQRADWNEYDLRVVDSTYRLLELFGEYDAKVTFFTLGWVAERATELIRAIVDAGHELASHGYDHTRVTKFDRAGFKADVTKTKSLLEDISGKKVIGYRAPTFSIDKSTPWAHDVLQETGHEYSSSAYPVKHDMYGTVGGSRFPFREPGSGMLEIPVSTISLFGHNLPCGGGGYFRVYPYRFTRWCFRRINEKEAGVGVFYMHPWEIDPGQPRVEGLNMKSRFRHYINLDNTESRLRRMLSDFKWSRMDEIFVPGSE